MSTIDPAAYAALQRELNQAHAYPAAIELDNARLIRETQQALEQQTTTAAILRIVSQSITDSQPVMEAIVASCHQLFPTDSAGIWLADDDEHGSLVAFRGPAYAGLETVPKRAHSDPDSVSVSHGQGQLLHYPDINLATDAPQAFHAWYETIGPHAAVMVPMPVAGRYIGSLITVRQPPRPFFPQEIAMLTSFVDQAVIAIENVRLFNEIEDKYRQLEVANQHRSEFLANMSHELRTHP